jgi:hypothetical protein
MCVCATATRRRREAKMDPRYKYGNRSIDKNRKRLAMQLEKQRAIAIRKGAKR